MPTTAFLSSSGELTCFSYGAKRIRFRTSPKLTRYERVKKWDHGYLVVDATYSTLGTVEEYIDLIPVLQNLLFDADAFLDPIKEVKIRYDTGAA